MSTPAWAITGNAGTVSGNDFLGTTDNQPLVIKTGGVERVRVDTSGNVGIGGAIIAGGSIQAPLIGIGQQGAPVLLGSPSPGTLAIGTPNAPVSNVELQGGGIYAFGAESRMAVGTYSDPNPNVLRDLKLGANGLAVNGGLVVNTGPVGIGTVSPRHTLDVSGDIGVTGSIEVTGDVFLTGADCAEEFDTVGSQPPGPGTVVVIDADGALRESRSAYDKKVAGVVSCGGEYRHGIVLDRHPEEGRIPVALVGKVYCKVDAQYSPIEVGDLLTTAPTPGHAMKATEPVKAFGAIIGKALRSFKQGQGLIPILVALQ